MHFLIYLARKIDQLNEKIGSLVNWALLLAVLICAGNAIVRYTLNNSSNGWLEIQWYLFAAVFLLGAPYTLRRNEHVRIDVITGRFSKRTQVWIDLFGFIFFLLPMAGLILFLGAPYALHSFTRNEMSSNAGGLIEWPAKLLIPLGFALLVLQGCSEIIKRIGFLRGLVDASEFEKQTKTPEDEVEDMKRQIASTSEDRE
ncbi:TRAP transporter small permease subunit [Undibacterium fentianense]|uniref:TRAP transporter small permease protein n=1 Tax=Undibacterium fentianense TaxID=2828728 RepID=A0A941E112_9BURK|nr:TRAP transporter small permease subunit [Undibacterium fentianense]MBR7799077.1 TRAP transporter small permease subunit [Undibacterium fentianense]